MSIKRSLITVSGGIGLAVLIGATFAGSCSSEEPKIVCQTPQGAFSAKYSLQSGSGDCAKLTGDLLRVHTYPAAPDSPDAWARFDKPSVALRPDQITDLIGEYKAEGKMEQRLYSGGPFVNEFPGPDGFCTVGSMTSTALSLDAVPADPMDPMSKPLPAVDLKYEWTNVRIYVSAAAIGTEFTADLKYTQDGCIATYKVTALYPSVGCEKTMTVKGPDGKPMEMGTGKPDDDACFPCAQPDKGHPTGSGIVPNIDVACDPDMLLCLPRNELPSLRSLQCPL
jgi:hypothetical protein